MRRFCDVSRVFDYSLIWRLFTLSGSLWVSWTRYTLMRNGSFWSTPASSIGSWVWRKLLKLRDEVKPFIQAKVNDGNSVSFWFDRWLPIGRIIEITGMAGPRLLGIHIHVMVEEAAGLSGWKLRRTRQTNLYPLLEQIRSHDLPNASKGRDQFFWGHRTDEYKPLFSSYHPWNQLRVSHNTVHWGSTVWFQQGIPRYGFITWLAMHDRLPTGT